MDTKVSVIIPVYNVEPYIRQCLDSVVNQTYRNLEIILIDDGSPDNCGVICDEYAAKDERIRVIHKENEGVRAARNDGIVLATGELIAFVDSDDWCELDYYEQLLNAMSSLDVDIFCAGGPMVERKGIAVAQPVFTEPFFSDTEAELYSLMAKVLYGRCCTIGTEYAAAASWDKIYKTAFLRQNDLRFDVLCKAWDDLLFNYKAFSVAKKIGGCGYIGYHYRTVETSIVHGFNVDKPTQSYYFLSKIHEYISGHNAEVLLTDAINARGMMIIRNLLSCDYFHPANELPYREVANQILEMKMMPHYHEAIYAKNNRYLSGKEIVWKYLLQLPWVLPLKLAYMMRQIISSS